MLSRQQIEGALRRLGELVLRDGGVAEFLIVGGGAMVLSYDARNSTKDIDFAPVADTDLKSLRKAAAQVAAENSWPANWLNDGAKGFLHGRVVGTIIYESPGIRVYRPSTAQLLAMKLAAWRDDVDIADADLLLERLGCVEFDQVWSEIAEYVPPGFELKVQYALHDLCDSR